MPPTLSVSIVTFKPDFTSLIKTLDSVSVSVDFARRKGHLTDAVLILIDNGPGEEYASCLNDMLRSPGITASFSETIVISGHGNVGFGAAHNLAISEISSDFHLILNPDVIVDRIAISEALIFMEESPDAGVISPMAFDNQEARQFLCKRYPTVLDLALRGFAPAGIQRLFKKRLDHYETRDVCGEENVVEVSIVSGCFMFFRSGILKKTGGFARKFFLYFEDFDLSLRVAEHARLMYVPSVRICHFGGHAGRKGWRHIFMFARSAFCFYQNHGWKFF